MRNVGYMDNKENKSSTNVRILHIVESLNVNGRTTLLYELINHMGSQFHHLILTLKWQGELSQRFRELGVEIFSLGLNSTPINLIKRRKLFINMMKFSPDLCVCWSGGANLVSIFLKCINIPVIWSVHNTIESWQDKKHKLSIKLSALVSHFVPYKIVCCSHETHKIYSEIHKYSNKKLFTISNGIDTGKFKPDEEHHYVIRSELLIPKNALVIASAMRVDKREKKIQGDFKGVETLIKAIKIVCRQKQNVYFILFGVNIDYNNDALVEKLKEGGIEDRVKLLGFRRDVNKLFAAADIIAISSTSEGLPMALIEGMACGAIPVCTDPGEIKNVVGSLGKVVAQKDPEALANGFINIIDQEENVRKTISLQVVDRIKSKYSIGNVAKSYAEMIRSAVYR